MVSPLHALVMTKKRREPAESERHKEHDGAGGVENGLKYIKPSRIHGHSSQCSTNTRLNTLCISLVRIDYAPYGGLNPPHTHPRATKILVVVEGTLYVGFVTSNPENRLFTKVLYPGDVFVFPVGLIHFQFNIGHTNAVAFAGLSSQNPGVITIANAVFGSDPAINPDVLAKAFQLDKNIVKQLQSRFWWDNN
ncbi:Germin-like protein subfamily 1 member 17 [Hibiscus syriacus]|uniref:Germin-like protein n=1 Tax=Hibiscus syriacus TaxID=106335 RepID=A0A6A3D1Z9_HIBSY|nr:Germin-like protein subfamily 1 member 17 [Hibiscus syriacus]